MADGTIVSSVPLDESDNSAVGLENRIKDEQHKQSLQLRRQYGWTVLILTIFQVLAINAFFAFDALGTIPFTPFCFHVSDDLFKVFGISVFASVIALGYGVTKSLFPGEGGFWSAVLGFFGKKEA